MKKIIIPLILIILILFSACDWWIYTVEIKISEYPDKLVYLAGVDDALDLTGLEIKEVSKDKHEAIYKFSKEPNVFDLYIENDYESVEIDNITLEYEIDFEKPGIYIVIIELDKFSCTFPVQVIDQHYFDNLRE